jgi:Flp pilus assembly protein TadD
MRPSFLSLLNLLLCTSLLVGCATKPDALKIQRQVDGLDRSVVSGQVDPQKALDDYRSLAEKYNKEPIAVAGYAEALRRVGQAKESADILRPLVKGQTVEKLPDPIFMAYMRLLLGQGYYKDVQERVQKRLALSQTDKNAQLYNLLGVALAGQGKKTDAESAFRSALHNWDGRQGVVEQNLSKLKAKP